MYMYVHLDVLGGISCGSDMWVPPCLYPSSQSVQVVLILRDLKGATLRREVNNSEEDTLIARDL